MRASLELV